MKYALMIDYAKIPGLKHVELEAKTLIEAIDEANKIDYESENPIYVMEIYEKSGKAEKVESGLTRTEYVPVLCKRNDWHSMKDEYIASIYYYKAKYGTWFDYQ